MNSKFNYNSDSYDRESQRFIIPLYIKDNLGNYEFSSTGTLAKYNNHYFIIFAAHALSDTIAFNDVYTFFKDGSFFQLKEAAIGYQVFKNEDIVIVDCFNNYFDSKNYFNINKSSLHGFEKRSFAWTGFPVSKSKTKKIHNSKSPSTLKEQYVISSSDGDYFTNVKYFTIVSKIKSNNRVEITGEYDRNGANLKYAGKVSTATHPSGMSGGAMYFFSKNQELKESIDDTFRFAGIGVSYKKDNTIVGVSRTKIIELIEKFNAHNPLTITLSDDN